MVYPDNLMQADEDEDEVDGLREGEGGGETGVRDVKVEERRKGGRKGKDVRRAKAGAEELDVDVEQLVRRLLACPYLCEVHYLLMVWNHL